MDKISIAKTLLKYIGRDSIENDWAIAQGILVILDGVNVQESVQKPVQEPKPEKSKATPSEKPKRRPFDVGKLGALRKAGWSVAKVTDELGVSEATVYKYMKQEGIA